VNLLSLRKNTEIIAGSAFWREGVAPLRRSRDGKKQN
jgi:hypothetical protein